jgi:hypothetical protein
MLACLALVGASTGGCGSGGGGGGTPPAPPPPAPAPVPPPPFPAPEAQYRVSAASAFTPGCDGAPARGTLFVNAEVEAHVAINPANPANLVGAWQQDRWSSGAAAGLRSAVSTNGGVSWTLTSAPLSRCSGGNAGNGGDYERATDPWVTFAPDGTAYQMSLSLSGQNFTAGSANAMLVARSTDGGATWSNPVALIVDGATAFNDKNTITADPTDANFVYAVWDRLAAGRGPLMFARTTNAGASWEAARVLFDPGLNSQTIGSVIAVLPNGTLVLLFTQLDPGAGGATSATLRVMRSTDRGVNWSAPVTVAALLARGAFDPESLLAIRDGAILAQIAAAPNGDLHVVWQDARFSSGAIDAIAIARSTDGGLTWSAPARVNSVPTAQAFTPQVNVRADGVLAVSYHDLRSNTLDAGATLPTEVWLATSRDSGATWTETRVAGPFDLLLAPSANGLFLGDYAGLASYGTTFLPFFVQTTRDGAANRNDVFARPMTVTLASAAAARVYRAERAVPAAPDAAWRARVSANIERTLDRRGRVPPAR